MGSPSLFFGLLLGTVLVAGILVAFVYTGMLLHKLAFDTNEEESISLTAAAKISASKAITPVFGEAAWCAMIGVMIFALTCRAGWQNLSKVAMQFQWQEDEDGEVVNRLFYLSQIIHVG